MCYSAAGKVCVAIMIIALMLIGLAFFIAGVFPLRQHVSENFKDFSTKTVSTAQYYFIASGLLALVVCGLSLLGICFVLWWTESRCLFYWLALIVVLAIIVDILLIIEVEKVKSKFNDFLTTKLPFYGIIPSITRLIDFYQRKFFCCGVNGPDDYEALDKKIPNSCCPVPIINETDIPGNMAYRFGDTERARRIPDQDYSFADAVGPPRNHYQTIPEPHVREPMFVGHEDVPDGQGDGYFNVNVSTNIGFELPPKNMTDMRPPGGNGTPKPEQIAGSCKGCLYNFLVEYKPYFITFYVIIAAKMLLQLAVAVSPCWLMIKDKMERMEERPSDEDGISMVTIDNRGRR